jgi:PAS domain S-box-containing protein
MIKKVKSKKEITIIFYAFLFILILMVVSKFQSFQQIETMHKIVLNIYEHPLKVSNASLTINADIYKIHRDMKDIVLSSSQKELRALVEGINIQEKVVYKNLTIIKEDILGKEGLELYKETFVLFSNWKPIREEVIALVKNNQLQKAIEITKNKGAIHVSKLENSSNKLYEYARNKAANFKNEANSTVSNMIYLNYEISLIILVLFVIIMYSTLSRISKYIDLNLHLNAVLTLIREVHTLIIREKDIKIMLQESCNILTTNHIYGHAWIVTLDTNYKIENVMSSGSSENLEAFKNKIINKCAVKSIDVDNNAINIKLEYNNIVYGYLNISIDTKYKLVDKEMSLLSEVAEDISYAIYNIQIEQKYLSELKLKKQELEKIIQEAPNPIMVHNEEGKIILVNKTWENLSGYLYKDIDTISKWTQKAYGKDMPVVKKYIDELYGLNHKVDEGEYKILTKNNKQIIWKFNTAPLGIIDGSRTVISSAMDITELKEKDEMLINQSRQAAMGEMIGMIAHQWRQPISTISMTANNMLLDYELGELNVTTAKAYAQSISEQIQHLSKTIDDFRNFFKSDKGILKVKIQDIFEQTLTILRDSLNHSNIEVETFYETKNEVNVYPRELMQVFINIINNAKDVLVSNKVKLPLISVKVYEDEKYINALICDNGGGIDKKILGKIFEPYFSTKNEKNGTGLGLYMSKMIIEKHLNGAIEVYNSNNGACFTIKLLK